MAQKRGRFDIIEQQLPLGGEAAAINAPYRICGVATRGLKRGEIMFTFEANRGALHCRKIKWRLHMPRIPAVERGRPRPRPDPILVRAAARVPKRVESIVVR